AVAAVVGTHARMQLSAAMRPFFLLIALLGVACKHPRPGNPPPVRAPRATLRVAPPLVVRATALAQRASRLELKALQQEAPAEARVAEAMPRSRWHCGSRPPAARTYAKSRAPASRCCSPSSRGCRS